MQKWEHLQCVAPGEDALNGLLERLGGEGWELVFGAQQE